MPTYPCNSDKKMCCLFYGSNLSIWWNSNLRNIKPDIWGVFVSLGQSVHIVCMHVWSVMSNSLLPHGFILCVCVCLVAKSFLTLYNPMDWSPLGSSVLGISQARILEWVSISFSRTYLEAELNSSSEVSHVLWTLCLK